MSHPLSLVDAFAPLPDPQWVAALPVTTAGQGISLDGKTLRHSFDRAGAGHELPGGREPQPPRPCVPAFRPTAPP
jgi:hypothetical protein